MAALHQHVLPTARRGLEGRGITDALIGVEVARTMVGGIEKIRIFPVVVRRRQRCAGHGLRNSLSVWLHLTARRHHCAPPLSQHTTRNEIREVGRQQLHIITLVGCAAEFGQLAHDILTLRFLCRLMGQSESFRSNQLIFSILPSIQAQFKTIINGFQRHRHGQIPFSRLYGHQSLESHIIVAIERRSGFESGGHFQRIEPVALRTVHTESRQRSRPGIGGPFKETQSVAVRETGSSRPITYELKIDKDDNGRPYVKEERLRQRWPGRVNGRPLSILKLENGKGYAYEGTEGGEDEKTGQTIGNLEQKPVELSDTRRLGIVTLGAMKQYERIEQFLSFLKSWYL